MALTRRKSVEASGGKYAARLQHTVLAAVQEASNTVNPVLCLASEVATLRRSSFPGRPAAMLWVEIQSGTERHS